MSNYLRNKTTGSGPLSVSVEPSESFQIEAVRIHLAVAVGATENLVVSLVSASGTEYDVVLATAAMNALTDYVYLPTRPQPGFKGDKIKVVWANASSCVWGLEIIHR